MVECSNESLTGLARKLVVGSGLRLSSFVLVRFFQVARIVIFARLFTPTEIGIATLTAICIATMSLFGNFGFTQSVIRNRTNCDDFLDTAFTTSLIFGFITYFLTLLFAPALSWIFSTDLNTYVRFLAFMTLIVPLRFPSALWEKDLKFWHPSVVLVISEFAVLFASILVELHFRLGVWSLLVGSAFGFGSSVLYIWIFADYRPRIRIKKKHVRPLLNFGTPFMIQGLNSEAMARGDTLMVGAYSGADQLAFYNFAWQVPMLISSLTQTLDSILFPLYARLNDSPQNIIRLFNLSNKMWSITGTFLGFPVILYADRIVDLMYGPKWEPVVPILRIMALSFLIRFCTGYSYDNLAFARGRTKYLMKWGIVNTIIIFTVGQFMIVKLGAIGGAWFWTLQAIILGPAIRLPLIFQELGTLSYVYHVWQPIVSGLTGSLFAYSTLQILSGKGFMGVLISLFVFLMIYMFALFVLDRRLYSDIVRTLKMAHQ